MAKHPEPPPHWKDEHAHHRLLRWVHESLEDVPKIPLVTKWIEEHKVEKFGEKLVRAAEVYDAARYMPRRVQIGRENKELSGLATSYLEMRHRDGKEHPLIAIMGGSTSSREAQGPMAIYLYALGCDVIHFPQAVNMESWKHDEFGIRRRIRLLRKHNKVHGAYSAEARLVAEVLKHESAEELTLVGVSNGAPTMMRVAEQLAEKRVNLHLFSPGGFTRREEGTVKEAVRITKTFLALRKRVLADELENLLENWAIGLSAHKNRIIDTLLMLRVAFTLRAPVFLDVFGKGLLKNVRSFQVGVGSEDNVFPPARTKEMLLEHIPTASMYEMPDKDHNWQVQGAMRAAVMIMRQLEGQEVPEEI